jgi:hypothetical protein
MNKPNVYVIFTVLIIIGAAVYSALYSKPSSRTGESDNASVNGMNDEVYQAQALAPTDTVKNVTIGGKILIPNFTIFIDRNNNKTKDEAEEPCLYCVGRQIICTKTNIVSPSISDLLHLDIKDRGLVATEQSNVGDTCWAVFEDRKIFIPNIVINQPDSEYAIPAVYSTAIITGPNAYIDSVEKNSENEYIYTLERLIPSLKTRFDANQSVWVKFQPDESKPDNYYLRSVRIMRDESGTITQTAGSYYFIIDWNFAEKYSGIDQSSNYELVF